MEVKEVEREKEKELRKKEKEVSSQQLELRYRGCEIDILLGVVHSGISCLLPIQRPFLVAKNQRHKHDNEPYRC